MLLDHVRKLGASITRMTEIAQEGTPIRESLFRYFSRVLTDNFEPVKEEVEEVMEAYYGFHDAISSNPKPVFVRICETYPPDGGAGGGSHTSVSRYDDYIAFMKAFNKTCSCADGPCYYDIITGEEYEKEKGEVVRYSRDDEEIERGKAEARLRSIERGLYGAETYDAWEAEREARGLDD
tara:strand:+ start:77 stop:616 length:540 start_codon:yes stop_codon:yes gene_type:complete